MGREQGTQDASAGEACRYQPQSSQWEPAAATHVVPQPSQAAWENLRNQ
jgi:hypothetical protein